MSRVFLGLIAIAAVFGVLNEHFLSPENLTNLLLQMAATGTISLGIVIVLLLGEVDLSAGSVSGLAAVVMTILSVRQDQPIVIAIGAALAVAIIIGALHGLLMTTIRIPSFVVTLAGLIGWQGMLLYLLGKGGTINLPFDGFVASLSDAELPLWLSIAVFGLAVAVWSVTAWWTRSRRIASSLPIPAWWRTYLPIAATAVLLGAAIAVLDADRGVPLLVVIFLALVVCVDLVLRHTLVGRRIFAVGGNAEAARRAGINVTAVRILGFAACSALAGFGGMLAASRLAAVNQSSGGSDILLMAIAAAVIGGTSLFGGRGSAYSALLGILVIQSISNGMLLLNVNSSVRFMVTATVLIVAVGLDSVSRRQPT